GPVHLDISATVAGRPAVPLATSCRPDPPPYPDREALDRAARAISDASRPLLLAGSHCRSSDAAQWLRAFVEALPAPLLTTARAKGALPDPHPLMLGVLGVSGVEARLLGRADLVIAIGLDARVVRLAREVTPAGTIATADAGAHYAGVATSWHAIAPREFLVPSSLATAGFALPAAIAAHLVHPDRRVVCFTGANELADPSE